MFQVAESSRPDLDAWLTLAKQVEHLLGPMVDSGFDRAVLANIDRRSAFCVRNHGQRQCLAGGLLFDYRSAPDYQLSWLAVDNSYRRKGIGQLLVRHALNRIIKPCSVEVITFGHDHTGGLPARRFYESFGFRPGPLQEPGPEGGSRQAYILELFA